MDNTFAFTQSDGGRSLSRRPKQRNDCTVRAVALVTGTPYDEVYDLLAADAGRRCAEGVYLGRWLVGRIDPCIGEPEYVFGWTAERLSFPAVKGQRRMNPVSFAAQFPQGRFICFTARHVYATIDGVVYDTAATYPERCIYTAWRFFRK